MGGLTNKAKKETLDSYFRSGSTPSGFYVALVTDATVPGPDTNTMSNLDEIATGNGYPQGGFSRARNSTDFPSANEDDSGDKGTVEVKELSFTPSGGPVPASGNAARFIVLTDNNSNKSNRKVIAHWDIGKDLLIGDGQLLVVDNLVISARELA